MKDSISTRFGGLTAIVGVATALAGLFTLFAGTGQPDDGASLAEVLSKANSFSQATTGAEVLVVGMAIMLAFTAWVAYRHGRSSGFVAVGAGILGLGWLTHLIENLFVVGLYGKALPALHAGSTDPAVTAMHHIAIYTSNLAFAFLGAGALVIAVGFLVEIGAPRWLGIWGVVAGVVEIVSAFVMLPPAMPLLLAWLVTIGIRGALTSDPQRVG